MNWAILRLLEMPGCESFGLAVGHITYLCEITVRFGSLKGLVYSYIPRHLSPPRGIFPPFKSAKSLGWRTNYADIFLRVSLHETNGFCLQTNLRSS
jgi:hypothetical protein